MENDIKEIGCVGCLSKDKTFFGKKNGFNIYKCSNCRMLSLYKKPQTLDQVYNSEYFSGGSGGFGYVNYDEDKEPMRNSFKKYLDLITKISNKKGKLFDVGAATGFFMSLAKVDGFEVSGVEFSDFAAGQGRSRGFDIKTGTLDKLAIEEGGYEVVTMLDVIEHMPDPENDIKIIQKMLKQNGLVVVNTPDSGSFYARMMGINWHLVVPPEHIHYFNERGIRELFTRNGFEVLLVTRMSKKFTLEYIFNMLFKWLKVGLFQKIAIRLKGTSLGRLSLPTDLRDNMFIVAKKL
ncbi:MAG: class I SAM-dependent methyltransferase [Patescibacteria group bacterium]